MSGGRALDGRGLRDRDARSGADGKRAGQYQDGIMPCSPVSASTPACQRARCGQGQGASAGRPVAEAAHRLGIPEGTVKSRTHYALRSLKLTLEEMGVIA